MAANEDQKIFIGRRPASEKLLAIRAVAARSGSLIKNYLLNWRMKDSVC
jgi:hypothetical protein